MQKRTELTMDRLISASVSYLILCLGHYGVEIEKTETFKNSNNSSGISFFISIPKTNELKLDSGNFAEGEELAEFAKQRINQEVRNQFATVCNRDVNASIDSNLNLIADDLGISLDKQIAEEVQQLIQEAAEELSIKVLYKIRDEDWTRQKEEIFNVSALSVFLKREGN